jgi:hypothetical protein
MNVLVELSFNVHRGLAVEKVWRRSRFQFEPVEGMGGKYTLLKKGR